MVSLIIEIDTLRKSRSGLPISANDESLEPPCGEVFSDVSYADIGSPEQLSLKGGQTVWQRAGGGTTNMIHCHLQVYGTTRRRGGMAGSQAACDHDIIVVADAAIISFSITVLAWCIFTLVASRRIPVKKNYPISFFL